MRQQAFLHVPAANALPQHWKRDAAGLNGVPSPTEASEMPNVSLADGSGNVFPKHGRPSEATLGIRVHPCLPGFGPQQTIIRVVM